MLSFYQILNLMLFSAFSTSYARQVSDTGKELCCRTEQHVTIPRHVVMMFMYALIYSVFSQAS